MMDAGAHPRASLIAMVMLMSRRSTLSPFFGALLAAAACSAVHSSVDERMHGQRAVCVLPSLRRPVRADLGYQEVVTLVESTGLERGGVVRIDLVADPVGVGALRRGAPYSLTARWDRAVAAQRALLHLRLPRGRVREVRLGQESQQLPAECRMSPSFAGGEREGRTEADRLFAFAGLTSRPASSTRPSGT